MVDYTACHNLLQSVTFVKLYDWTTLHVRWRGTLRGAYGWGGGWGRWRILFNGGHCGDPGWIESINYNSESNTDHMKQTGSKSSMDINFKNLVLLASHRKSSAIWKH